MTLHVAAIRCSASCLHSTTASRNGSFCAAEFNDDKRELMEEPDLEESSEVHSLHDCPPYTSRPACLQLVWLSA